MSIIEEDRYYSCSSSGRSSSSSSFDNAPVIVARAECFETNTYQHIEDKSPYVVAMSISGWCLGRDILKTAVHVNGIRLPLETMYETGEYSTGDLQNLILNAVSVSGNNFFDKGDFEL